MQDSKHRLEPVCLFIGRFQPFTLGHLKCCEMVWKYKKLKTVVLIINTTKADEKHPFLTKDLMGAYKNLAKDYDFIKDIILVSNADIVKNTEACREAGYEPVAWVCGSDRVNDYRRMVDKYKEDLGLASDFDVFEIPRTDSDISATKCREALLKGDERSFAKMVPPQIDHIYFRLKKLIEEVYNK